MSTSQLDTFLDHYYKARVYAEKNKKVIYIALTVLIVLIAGTIFYTTKQKANNEKAAVHLAKLKPLFESGKYNQVINGDSTGTIPGIISLVKEYGSTENGEAAKFYLASSYYYLRDFDNANKYYKDYGGSNNLLKAASIAGEAGVYEAKKDYINAAKSFEKAASVKDNAFADEYLFYAGRNYFMAGDKENTKRIFKQLKTEYPKSTFNTQSQRYTYDLGIL
jgi:tetratricopeptide (TPR) repeat protein